MFDCENTGQANFINNKAVSPLLHYVCAFISSGSFMNLYNGFNLPKLVTLIYCIILLLLKMLRII